LPELIKASLRNQIGLFLFGHRLRGLSLLLRIDPWWWGIKTDFPVVERWVGGFAADELEDVLGGAPLGVLGVEHVAILIEFKDVCENRVNLFESARLAKDAGVVDAFE
jgi:hypothetical protein